MGTHDSYREWVLRIVETPRHCEGQFLYSSKASGTQIWDSMIWPMPASELSEAAILDEFYQLMMEFRSTRG